jgi:hypothetical protein
MNSNDQYKQGPKTDFGTDNPKRPELEGTDGGNVGTILFLHKRVLLLTKVMNLQYYHLILHQIGRSLCIKNIWNKKNNKKKRKRKKGEK